MRDDFNALIRHSIETDHDIDYNGVLVLASDFFKFILKIRETLKIQEYFEFKLLNGNTGSLKLNHPILKLFPFQCTSCIIVLMFYLIYSCIYCSVTSKF